MLDADALATIGHNNPPEPTPFELAEQSIMDLFDEAKHWLDGSGVNTQADADGVSKLLDMIRKAKKTADEARAEEKRPHDEAAKLVQEKYKPLLTRCDIASDTCKKALAPYLERLEAEKRAKAEAARKEAEQKARAAQEAMRAAHAADLAAREQAEALLQAAKKAEAAANRAEKDKAHAKGGARAVTLRTTTAPSCRTAFSRLGTSGAHAAKNARRSSSPLQRRKSVQANTPSPVLKSSKKRQRSNGTVREL